MVLLDNDAFLTELVRMFEKSRASGIVTLTIKKWDGRSKPNPREGRPPLPVSKQHYCLVRATWKKKKISTIIVSTEVNRFQQAYWNLLKANINGLKKLKKVKSTKPKAH